MSTISASPREKLLERRFNPFVCVIGDETTALTTGAAKYTFRAPYKINVSEVRASVATAPEGAAVQVDVKANGASIFSTPVSISSFLKTSVGSAFPAVIATNIIDDDAEITIDVSQVGSAVAGAGLKVLIIASRAT